MPTPNIDHYGRDLLELLKFELMFIEQGGYGRSVHTPQQATTMFMDSPTCLNFGEGKRELPCEECLLTLFVPAEQQKTEVPCHHIVLNEKGETIQRLVERGDERRLQEAVAGWLRNVIRNLEAARAKNTEHHT